MEGYSAVRLLVARLNNGNVSTYEGGNHGTDRNVYTEVDFVPGEYLILV